MENQLSDKSAIDTGEMVLNMGPQHPSTHGVLRLKIHTDGEIVSKIEPILGYLHRCFEKHCEALPYEQIVPFTDRCDYLASMHMDHAYSSQNLISKIIFQLANIDQNGVAVQSLLFELPLHPNQGL